MQVCHTQPHLVPPMKLVVYDDLPSPRIHHSRNSLSISSWIEEGRNLASRASNRASLTISRNRHTTTPLKISGPSDFRRVQSFDMPSSTRYKPLDLRIHRSGNRLSDLPEFESFQCEEDRQRQTLAIPPPSFAPPSIPHRRCVSTASGFTVSRKPVGSGSNRYSLGNMEFNPEPRKPVRIASSLIPHFSVVSPVQVNPSEALLPAHAVQVSPLGHVRSYSEESKLTLDTDILTDPSESTQASPTMAVPQTPVTRDTMEETIVDVDQSFSEFTFLDDSPSTASSRTFPSRLSSLHRPPVTPTENRNTIASVPLPNRLSQWFFPGKAKDTSPTQVSLASEKGFEWERTRTLSGTTIGSTTTVVGGAQSRRPNDSISSSLTGATTPRASLHKPSLSREKDLESGYYHSTIYEDRPPQPKFPPHIRQEDPAMFQEATIGIAF